MNSRFASTAAELVDRLTILGGMINLRPQTRADEDFLSDLDSEERNLVYASLGIPDALKRELLAEHMRAQAAVLSYQFPQAETLIIRSHTRSIGRLTLALERDPYGPALRIVDLRLAQASRSKGAGGSIVAGLIASARAMRLARVNAAVFSANRRAIGFFRKRGFKRVAGGDAAAHHTLFYPLP